MQLDQKKYSSWINHAEQAALIMAWIVAIILLVLPVLALPQIIAKILHN